MVNRFYMSCSFALVTLLFTTGCQPLGPQFEGFGKPPIPTQWQNEGIKNEKEIAKWWKIFGDSTLDRLIQKAYAQNLNLKSAGLRIIQSRAILGVNEGYKLPQKQTLSGSGASVRSQDTGFTTASINFDIGWEMDFWGKYARNIESSQSNLYLSIASYNDIMVSIIAEVARNYINYRTAQERIAYAKRNITIQERVTELTKVQFNAGNVSELDLQQSLSQLYNTKALLPLVELSKVKAKNALALLLGMNSSDIEPILQLRDKRFSDSLGKYIAKSKRDILQIKQKSQDILNVTIIPTAKFNPNYSIDANLLTRRPDIKVAEYKVRSNNALIGATIAELYPSFSLFGNIGYNTNNSSGSWTPSSQAIGVSVGPAFSWNILQYGRIKNQIRLKDALFEESLVDYNQQILLAVQEISDALSGYTLGKQQQEENYKAVEATVRAFNISVIQYNDGLVGYERLLTTVENLTRTQDQYAQIKGNLATNIVLLYKALGGGWQISRGRSYLSTKTAQKMKKRIDWGQYLDQNMTQLPKGI